MTQSIGLGTCKDIFDNLIHAGPLLDEGKLAGALEAPFQSAFGSDAYPTLIEKAAELIEAIVTAHPYADGNKRLAWLLASTFLELNGVDVVAEESEAAQVVLDLVTHDLDRSGLVAWFVLHTKLRACSRAATAELLAPSKDP